MASQTACKFPSGFSFEKGWRPPSFWNSKNQNGHKNPHTEPVKFVIMRFLRKWLTVKLEVCWSEGLIQSKSQGRVLLHKIHTHTNTYMVLWNQRSSSQSVTSDVFFVLCKILEVGDAKKRSWNSAGAKETTLSPTSMDVENYLEWKDKKILEGSMII